MVGKRIAESKKLALRDLKKTPSPDSLQLLFRSRRSVRRYKDRPLLKKDLEKILEAGRYTATGTNSQNVRYIVWNDSQKISELKDIIAPILFKLFKFIGRVSSMPFGPRLLGAALADRMKDLYMPGMDIIKERLDNGEDRIFYNAKALIIVYSEKYDDTACFSSAAALYNCSLMAHTLGIGCCFNGFLQSAINNNKKIKKKLGIPAYCKCWGAMTLGYQNVKFIRLTKRKPANVSWM